MAADTPSLALAPHCTRRENPTLRPEPCSNPPPPEGIARDRGRGRDMGNSCSGSPKSRSGKDLGNSCVAGASPSVLGKTPDPAFKWKIYGFSALLEKGTIPAYSGCFHCSGYKWYLQLTPMHEQQSGTGIPYVALSLFLSRSNIKAGCTIKAVFEISMYNHSNGTYCGYQASYSFQFKKINSDIKCLIPLDDLLKSSDFLVDDSCIFGVKIIKVGVSSGKNPLVAHGKSKTVQNLFLQKAFIKGTYTWTLNCSSKLSLVLSPWFDAAGHKWCIAFYPLGDDYSTDSVSMDLYRQGSKELPPDSGTMIELTLSILDQVRRKQQFIRQVRLVYAGKNAWGWCDLIPLKRLMNRSKGCLVGSKCIVKADITIIGSLRSEGIMPASDSAHV